MKNIDENKTKYFIIAIALLIILGVILIIHFNNKSMVSGEKVKVKDTTTTTTTEPVTTIKKVIENKEVSTGDIYKSVIDEDNKLVYDYKLSDEIKDTDKIISTVLDINDEYKTSNIIGLFDISLYDIDNNKKSVSNSLINISIPIVGDLVGYEDYKVVYVKDGIITDEEFNTEVKDGYIKFSTTHLSVYGIIGINKVVVPVNIEDANVTMLYNDEKVIDTIYITPSNTTKLVVDGVSDYELYYGLKDKNTLEVNYVKYIDEVLFNDVKTYDNITVVAKLVIGNESKTFEFSNVKVYDVIVDYDNNNEEVNYDDIKGKNILLNDVTVKEEEENVEEQLNEEEKELVEIEGNIYLVDKADISNLSITGNLIIDTKEQIDFSVDDNNNINTSKLETIVIMSKEFNLNGKEYTYEIKGDLIIITEKRSSELEEDEQIEIPVEEDGVLIEEENNFFDSDILIKVDEDKNLVIEFNKEKQELLD